MHSVSYLTQHQKFVKRFLCSCPVVGAERDESGQPLQKNTGWRKNTTEASGQVSFARLSERRDQATDLNRQRQRQVRPRHSLAHCLCHRPQNVNFDVHCMTGRTQSAQVLRRFSATLNRR